MPTQKSVPFKLAMERAALRLHRERVAEAQGGILESMSERWVRTVRARAFLASLEARLASESLSDAMTSWLDWARNYIDQLDPLSVSSLADLRSTAETLAPDPVDDEPWDQDEQYWRDMGWLDEMIEEE